MNNGYYKVGSKALIDSDNSRLLVDYSDELEKLLEQEKYKRLS